MLLGLSSSVHESTIYTQKKEEEIHQSVGEADLSGIKVTSVVCDKAMEKMEK